MTSGYGRYWKRIIGCEENDKEWRLVLQTVRFIERATNGSDTRPFFIAIGHHRPHIPWESPSRFIDQYYSPRYHRRAGSAHATVRAATTNITATPSGNANAAGIAGDVSVGVPGDLPPDVPPVPVAKHRSFPVGTPPVGWKPFFLQNSTDQLVTDTFARYIRAAYMGAVSYMDNNFGVVLAALEASGTASNTAVVLFGDHGWHLGERNNWEKKSLYEVDCRVPFIVRAPWLANGGNKGKRTAAIASALDVMPTLIELAGAPVPDPAGVDGNLGGTSLVDVISDSSVCTTPMSTTR